jgi:carbamoyl-phosphate synthase large subunit
MKILISGVGGPTPRSISRSIKISKYKERALLFGTDISPTVYGLYEHDLYEKNILVPSSRGSSYWDILEAFSKENEIEYAMIHPEQAVLAWSLRKKQGGAWPCKTILPDYDLVKVLIDKGIMTDILKDSSLVPTSFVLNPKNLDYKLLEKTLPYPFWIRSTSGSSGLGSLKVEDRDSLTNWITINPGVIEFIASTYLPGRNLACKLLYYNGELIRSASGERVNYIMSKVAPSGITGNTSFGRLLNEPDLVNLAIKAMDILFETTNTPKHGFFTADFKEDIDGRPYITEINVRMVAFNYSFAQAGANFAEDILALISEDPDFDRNYKMYEFIPGTVFLRDVDVEPILMNESDFIKF